MKPIFSSLQRQLRACCSPVAFFFLTSACLLPGCFAPVDELFPPSPYNCQNLPVQYQNIAEQIEYQFILWRDPAAATDIEFKQAVLTTLASEVMSFSPDQLRVWIHDPSINSLTLNRRTRADGSQVGAIFSASMASPVDAQAVAAQLAGHVVFVAAYETAASIPVEYTKDWLDGERSPGLVSLSFFQKRGDLSKQAFKDYWFCSHTPFAIDIHPMWRYQRFFVTQAITVDAPDYDGIVPVHVRYDNQITDFDLFFGNNGADPLTNSLRINTDSGRFLNLNNIETNAMREYVIKSFIP